jgi:hypothetical protein
MQSNIAPAPGGFAPQHVELMAKDKVFFQRGPRSEPPDQGAPDQCKDRSSIGLSTDWRASVSYLGLR